MREKALLEAKGDAKVILENKNKADIYGVDLTKIPTLNKKIDHYMIPNTRNKKNVTMLLLKRIKKQREKIKAHIKTESHADITIASK